MSFAKGAHDFFETNQMRLFARSFKYTLEKDLAVFLCFHALSFINIAVSL